MISEIAAREALDTLVNQMVRGEYSTAEAAFSFIGRVVGTVPRLEIAGEEWKLAVSLAEATANEPNHDGLPVKAAVTLPSGARLFLTNYTK
jgi:hypothetical protein